MDLETLKLIRRFPGILGDLGSVASRMAEAAGRRGPWVWYDVQSREPGGYVAFVFGRRYGQRTPLRFPITSDDVRAAAAPPSEQRFIRPDDEPYVFYHPAQAEMAAREGARRLHEQLLQQQNTGD